MPLSTSALAALREFILTRLAAAPAAKEQKMLQGLYRGYAGDPAEEASYFASPQMRVADYYAAKRAAQTGEPAHTEMLLVDPDSGKPYTHATMQGFGYEPMQTQARKSIKPEDIKSRTQLKARGGLAKLKECSCHAK